MARELADGVATNHRAALAPLQEPGRCRDELRDIHKPIRAADIQLTRLLAEAQQSTLATVEAIETELADLPETSSSGYGEAAPKRS
jgi:hypothetical protein